MLLRTTFVALRLHRNRPHLRDVGNLFALRAGAAPREDEQRLPVLSAERARDDAAGRGNDAELFAVGSEHFDAGAARDIKAPFRIDRAAVAAAARQLGE